MKFLVCEKNAVHTETVMKHYILYIVYTYICLFYAHNINHNRLTCDWKGSLYLHIFLIKFTAKGIYLT